MMGTTPTYALPYPELADTPDVPRDIQALATKLDGMTGLAPAPTFVAAGGALPAAPVDGQEVYYQANEASGVVWHLRYRAAASNARKWEFIGGPDLFTYTQGQGNATTYTTITLAIPLTGDYLVSCGLRAQHNVYPFACRLGLKDGAGGVLPNANAGDVWPWIASDSNGAPAYARYNASAEFSATFAAGLTVNAKPEDMASNPVVMQTWLRIAPRRF